MTTTRSDAASPAARPSNRAGRGPIARLTLFLREVIAELGKVIWPTRSDLITYTIVVIIFVAVMIAIVAGLDLGFAKLVVWAFG